MINQGGDIQPIYNGSIVIQKVMYGIYVVYEGIKSCYGSGGWLNPKPYIHNDGWKN